MGKQVEIVKQVPFEEIEEVSFEDFDKTMVQIVKAKPPQKKPLKEDKTTELDTPDQPR